MNKIGRHVILAAIVPLAMTGCTKEDLGMATGAALGGLVGSQFGGGTGAVIATAVGVAGGALLGGAIGRSMDEVDRMKQSRALETAPTGRTVSWTNPDTGARYAVTPTKTWETASGPCREYSTEAWIDGRRETVHGTACRKPDGSWEAVN